MIDHVEPWSVERNRTCAPWYNGYGGNGDTAIGVIQGLRNAGKLGQVKVVAYDAEPGEVAALKAGDLIGLIAQQPVLEGQMAVEMAFNATKGIMPAKKNNILPDILIKRETMDQQSQYFYRGQ